MFYLVGSRFFGTHREDSDWDYLGEDTPENRKLCEVLGLKQIPANPQLTRYWNNGIDICLVSNLERSIRARDIAAAMPDIKELTKAERHQRIREIIHGLG